MRLWRELEQGLFPFMREEIGELDDDFRLFVAVCEAVVDETDFWYAVWRGNGRPPADRLAIAKTMLLKAVLNVKCTKDVVAMLRRDPLARRLCGWSGPLAVPSESAFSRANGEFAKRGITQKWFDDFVRKYLGGERYESASHDSAPVAVRARAQNARRMAGELDPDQPPPPPGWRQEWQRGQTAEVGLAELPTACDWGTKRDAHGKTKHWKGGKIHAVVIGEGIPVAVKYTSASLHDSQAMMPLMKLASGRVDYGFDLADAAYDSLHISEASIELGHVPVIDTNARNGAEDDRRKMSGTERTVYRARSAVERFFSHLLDSHGGRTVFVRDPLKIAQHLMYGILVIAVEQTFRMLC